ncbi:hypothetical protein AB835_04310 [Candidatus Endobugula sertula]|uniref:Glycosyltransferase 2-like domain-containing protein n=1 Tax=Candidatus Endobugula sertula TaxID=62101 RepID=A0A1D2QRP7_9GAMM|nr:hypothetical protein AB835_04310 [Candidatus Endobugula sertula]
MLTDKKWHHDLFRVIKQYSAKYAEKEALEITPYIPKKIYENSIIIPAYNESDHFFQRIKNSPLAQSKLLLIVIINQPDSDDDIRINQQLWDRFIESNNTINYSHFHHWLTIDNSLLDVLLINRFTEKIPHQQGVGLARKIGGDIICKLIQSGCLNNYWINTTDCDAHLPDNYFSVLYANTTQQHSAAIYPYIHQHSNDTQLLEATRHYEQWLNHYVEQLKKAGSPYAYHTLGSCMASNSLYYCQTRGFPKRAAGEDFYLLNKLTKLGKVITLNNTEITLDARVSDRVPFGTGPAVKKILAMDNPEEEHLYYHPQCFKELSCLLEGFSTLFTYRESPQIWLRHLSPPLQMALNTLGFTKLLIHINKQTLSSEQCYQHCHDWLDGFRTLKLIHLLEENYPRLPFSKLSLYQ